MYSPRVFRLSLSLSPILRAPKAKVAFARSKVSDTCADRIFSQCNVTWQLHRTGGVKGGGEEEGGRVESKMYATIYRAPADFVGLAVGLRARIADAPVLKIKAPRAAAAAKLHLSIR